MVGDELVREGHLAVDVDVIAVVVQARLHEQVRVGRHERPGDVQHAPRAQNEVSDVDVIRDVRLDDRRPVGDVRELRRDLAHTILELARRPPGERKGDVLAEALDVGINVVEDELAGVSRGTVHHERVRAIVTLDCHPENCSEGLAKLLLLERAPVLVEEGVVALEELLRQGVAHVVPRKQAVQVLMRDDLALVHDGTGAGGVHCRAAEGKEGSARQSRREAEGRSTKMTVREIEEAEARARR